MDRKKMAVQAAVIATVGCMFFSGVSYAATEKKAAVNKTSRQAQNDVEALVSAGRHDDARGALVSMIAAGKYPDVQDWAVLQLYSLAQQDGAKIQASVTALESHLAGNASNAALKRAIAEGYVRLKDWNKVAQIYEGLLAQNPGDQSLKIRLIDFYTLAGQAEKAVSMLEPIVQQSPNDRYFGDLLLNAYVAAGIKDKALALYQQRVAAKPNSAGLRGRYAQALQDFGLLRESLVQWKKAAELDPSNPFFVKQVKEVTTLINTRR